MIQYKKFSKVIVMNLKKPYLIIIFISFFFFLISQLLSFYVDYENSKITIYQNDKSAITNLINAQEENLQMFASILSSDQTIIEAYEKNDPQIIIEHITPIWQKMKTQKLIYEIHFFKPPAISFVNFSNFDSMGKDVSDARKDILWVTSSFKSSTHNLMCKTYAGIRATYPIVNKDSRLLGGLSLGKKIDWLPQAVKKNTERDSFLVYTKESVNTLDKKYYKYFMKGKTVVGDYILANSTLDAITPTLLKNIDFDKSVQYLTIKGHIYLLDKYPIYDFSQRIMGYIFVLTDVKPFLINYLKDLMLNFLLIVITAIIIFFVTKRALGEMNQKLQKSLNELNLAQATAKMGSYIYDLKSGHIEWSDNHYKLFKVDKRTFKPTRQKFLSFVHPEDKAYVSNTLDTAIKLKEEISFEYRIILRDATELYVNSTALLIEEQNKSFLIGTIQDITEHKKLELANQEKAKLLEKQLYTDELTELPNRRALIEDMKKYPRATFAIINIKSFKNINDVFGFDVGNFALQTLGEKLSKQAQKQGLLLYRIGSDEFALLNNTLKNLDFVRFIEQIITKTENDPLYYKPKEIEINISLYAGICLIHENRLACADVALNEANRLHKDYAIYSSSKNLIKEQESKLKMINTIKNALADDRILIYAQAIVDRNSEIHKYETLVRMKDETGKILSPFFFLEVSKKTKYYPFITRRVIEQAFETFENRSENFSINLIAEDILNESTLSFIREKIAHFEDKSRIIFEIVESEDIYQIPEVADFIKEMQSLGVKIAIDDFGTGYSNFSYLMELQPDYIKIDGSLIKEIDTNEKARNIVTTLITFAKELNCKTVAEFIHSKEVFNVCRELGIDEFQGYYFDEPHPL
jgi:diguanylate cyclase (GGDEF)-like protein